MMTYARNEARLDGSLATTLKREHQMQNQSTIAYFSMEIALDTGMPTYSGGLGVLAGDTVHSAADLGVPMVAVTLLSRKGYFYQRLDSAGRQMEEPVAWVVDDYLHETDGRASVTLEGRTVLLRAWKFTFEGPKGHVVPVFLLDTDLPQNAPSDRALTDLLYGGDERYRLSQEVILGIGGVRMLRALGYNDIQRFHMNEGHASLLTLELLNERLQQQGHATPSEADIQAIREQCVFTTHTPVEAGHDKFPMSLARRIVGDHPAFAMESAFCRDGTLNMTYVGFNLSHYINGVAGRHGEVAQETFPSYVIDAITNGVHAETWTSEPFQRLFDRHIRGWRKDAFSLRYALSLPSEEIWEAHSENKRRLIQEVNRDTNSGMDKDFLTLGFARRAATYKRADLLFHNLDRLKKIALERGPIQVVYAGKAHPTDQGGKDLIAHVFQAKEALKDTIKVAYLQNYDMELANLLIPGVDVWLNTPEPPREASGTSGMKAALNGVPSLSVLDGWWLEGCIEGVTGWAVGGDGGSHDRDKDAASLYDKLEQAVVPIFYVDRSRFVDIMRHCISLNGSFFHTQRMVHEYMAKAYSL